jgi:hypothetical protein
MLNILTTIRNGRDKAPQPLTVIRLRTTSHSVTLTRLIYFAGFIIHTNILLVNFLHEIHYFALLIRRVLNLTVSVATAKTAYIAAPAARLSTSAKEPITPCISEYSELAK